MKNLKALDFFCIGFGAIVGVGWAVSVNNWMVASGGPVPAALGYILVMLMMIPIAMCYCELVPMFPVAGGGTVFAYMAFNEASAALSGWAAYGAFIAIIPWEAIQITNLLSYLFPGIESGVPLYTCLGSDIYLGTVIVGILFSVILFLINIQRTFIRCGFSKDPVRYSLWHGSCRRRRGGGWREFGQSPALL